MSTADELTEALDTATGDEILQGTNLQASIDALLAMAKGLDRQVGLATEVDDLQAIGAAQAELNNQAMSLVTAQVRLLAGEAKVTAEHINAATRYAQAAIASMADWRKKIAATTKVVDFCAAVLSGDGTRMLETAIKLKAVL